MRYYLSQEEATDVRGVLVVRDTGLFYMTDICNEATQLAITNLLTDVETGDIVVFVDTSGQLLQPLAEQWKLVVKIQAVVDVRKEKLNTEQAQRLLKLCSYEYGNLHHEQGKQCMAYCKGSYEFSVDTHGNIVIHYTDIYGHPIPCLVEDKDIARQLKALEGRSTIGSGDTIEYLEKQRYTKGSYQRLRLAEGDIRYLSPSKEVSGIASLPFYPQEVVQAYRNCTTINTL